MELASWIVTHEINGLFVEQCNQIPQHVSVWGCDENGTLADTKLVTCQEQLSIRLYLSSYFLLGGDVPDVLVLAILYDLVLMRTSQLLKRRPLLTRRGQKLSWVVTYLTTSWGLTIAGIVL